jgi:hypothetical protein
LLVPLLPLQHQKFLAAPMFILCVLKNHFISSQNPVTFSL